MLEGIIHQSLSSIGILITEKEQLFWEVPRLMAHPLPFRNGKNLLDFLDKTELIRTLQKDRTQLKSI